MSGKAATTGTIIGILALCLAVPGTLLALNELGRISIFPTFSTPDSGPGPDPGQSSCPAEITLSTDRAPRGAPVTVHGSCFEPSERVVIWVHTTEVGSVTADSDGKFTQTITVPQSAPPPNFPTSIAATGRSSIKTATASFATSSA